MGKDIETGFDVMTLAGEETLSPIHCVKACCCHLVTERMILKCRNWIWCTKCRKRFVRWARPISFAHWSWVSNLENGFCQALSHCNPNFVPENFSSNWGLRILDWTWILLWSPFFSSKRQTWTSDFGKRLHWMFVICYAIFSILYCILLCGVLLLCHFGGVDESDCRQVRDGSGYTIKLGDKLRPHLCCV